MNWTTILIALGLLVIFAPAIVAAGLPFAALLGAAWVLLILSLRFGADVLKERQSGVGAAKKKASSSGDRWRGRGGGGQ